MINIYSSLAESALVTLRPLVQEIEKEHVAEREKTQRADEVMSTIDEANSRTPVPETLTIHESQPATTHDDQGTNFEGADGQP